ncbi:hypothetical protein N7472_000180 [Penicillium cf. griseofulvum]|uniref:Uncharacterized protein n=1 Tax=Penicillium cf. griseofulvum TaxID=2972120 RepID=A0A9W9MYS6_9EURO|nr:hypothetical protein N7472_000180 [Penicillium cf. griseofulvum]KAJ5424639.1 hypothetical protein N7445_010612 [Penicillium cf. griseofulvum]
MILWRSRHGIWIGQLQRLMGVALEFAQVGEPSQPALAGAWVAGLTDQMASSAAQIMLTERSQRADVIRVEDTINLAFTATSGNQTPHIRTGAPGRNPSNLGTQFRQKTLNPILNTLKGNRHLMLLFGSLV